MIKRLRVKFVCINMALVMAMLLAILGMVYHFTVQELERGSMDALTDALDSQMKPGRPGMVKMPCFVLQRTPGGDILVTGGEFYDLTDEEMVFTIYALAEKQDANTGVLEQYGLRYCRGSSPFGEKYAFTDISAEREILQNLLTACILIAVGGFCGFLAVSVFLSRWAIGPVERAFEQQKQFVADASHELKTPLTVILTNAEMLQDTHHSQEDKVRFAESILDVSRQMRSLVEKLLQLARTDREHTQITEILDLSMLVENAVLPFEPVYFERGLLLESQIEPGLQVRGDAVSVRQVVDILLDNGQKYGHGDTAVLRLSRQGKRAVLRFFTPGTPLTDRQCRDIFKRFYRLDEARTASGSYGLGLSIAENILRSHGGGIRAEAEDGGNVFTAWLPLT